MPGTRDIELVLDSARTLTANLDTAAINVEGGVMAWLDMLVGTVSGTTPTLDAYLQASIDNQGTWHSIGKLPQITTGSLEVRRPVYIPRPTIAGGATALAPVFVRMHYVVAGTTPSFGLNVFLEAVMNNAPPGPDEALGIGAAYLGAAT